jgi:phage host-nuclease inhibitor protein Gam
MVRKVQQEEEHINNFLHRKLTDLSRERLEIETQLEEEQTFLLQTLNKQLRDVNQRKDALKRKLV